MVKSNTITITVKEAETVIKVNKLSVDKTSGYVGDVFHFTDHIEGYVPDEDHYYQIIVYVNGTEYTRINSHPLPGDFKEDIKFDITFEEPGTYDVYTDTKPMVIK